MLKVKEWLCDFGNRLKVKRELNTNYKGMGQGLQQKKIVLKCVTNELYEKQISGKRKNRKIVGGNENEHNKRTCI
jgi:hypothetical protein